MLDKESECILLLPGEDNYAYACQSFEISEEDIQFVNQEILRNRIENLERDIQFVNQKISGKRIKNLERKLIYPFGVIEK